MRSPLPIICQSRVTFTFSASKNFRFNFPKNFCSDLIIGNKFFNANSGIVGRCLLAVLKLSSFNNGNELLPKDFVIYAKNVGFLLLKLHILLKFISFESHRNMKIPSNSYEKCSWKKSAYCPFEHDCRLDWWHDTHLFRRTKWSKLYDFYMQSGYKSTGRKEACRKFSPFNHIKKIEFLAMCNLAIYDNIFMSRQLYTNENSELCCHLCWSATSKCGQTWSKGLIEFMQSLRGSEWKHQKILCKERSASRWWRCRDWSIEVERSEKDAFLHKTVDVKGSEIFLGKNNVDKNVGEKNNRIVQFQMWIA